MEIISGPAYREQQFVIIKHHFELIVINGILYRIWIHVKFALVFDPHNIHKLLQRQQVIIRSKMGSEVFAPLDAECRFIVADGKVCQGFGHLLIPFGRLGIFYAEAVFGIKKMVVDMRLDFLRNLFQVPVTGGIDGRLVNNAALAPSVGIAPFIDIRLPEKPTAVMGTPDPWEKDRRTCGSCHHMDLWNARQYSGN